MNNLEDTAMTLLAQAALLLQRAGYESSAEEVKALLKTIDAKVRESRESGVIAQ